MKGFYLIVDHNNYAFINELIFALFNKEYHAKGCSKLEWTISKFQAITISGIWNRYLPQGHFSNGIKLFFGLSGFEAESLGSTSDNQIRMLNLRSHICSYPLFRTIVSALHLRAP